MNYSSKLHPYKRKNYVKLKCVIEINEYNHVTKFPDHFFSNPKPYSFNVHKAILASKTPYFDAMFSGAFRENTADQIFINEIEPDILELLLRFIYSGSIEIQDLISAKKLFEGAHFLQIQDVIDYSFQFISDSLNPENCLNLWILIQKYFSRERADHFKRIAVKMFPKIALTEEFLNLENRIFIEYIASVESGYDFEEEKVRAFFRWFECDQENRREALLQFVRIVNFDFAQEQVWKRNKKSKEANINIILIFI